MDQVKREMKSGIHAIYAQQNATEIPLKSSDIARSEPKLNESSTTDFRIVKLEQQF
jgi:hypothetical protein